MTIVFEFSAMANCLLPLLLLASSLSIQASLVRELLHAGDHLSRHLLEASNGTTEIPENVTCSWAEDISVCQPSNLYTFNLFRSVGNDFSNLYGDTLDCRITTDRAACTQDYCAWNEKRQTCVHIAFGLNRESSPCFAPAPQTPKLGDARNECPTYPNATACNAALICSWGASGCDQDVLKIFSGVSRLDYAKALRFKMEALSSSFFDVFDTRKNNFDWYSVLEWNIPETDCPDDIEQKACDIAQTVLEDTAPKNFYCSLRYFKSTLVSACEADPVCVYDDGKESCSIPNGPASTELLFKAAAPFVQSETDRKVFLVTARCPTISDEQQCGADGECVWNPLRGSCGISLKWIFDILTAFGGDTEDSVCSHYSISRDSCCLDVFNETSCNANTACSWSEANQACNRRFEYFIRSASARDPKVLPIFSDAADYCLEKKDEDTCQASSV